jgi:DNA-directed RNA polymerase specialized sigma24 family protein
MRDVVGLSYNEIADALEITLATVKWRIFKAREEVVAALAREGVSVNTSGAVIDDVTPAAKQL